MALNNHTELRNEKLCVTHTHTAATLIMSNTVFVLVIDIYNDHGIGKLHFCKECTSCNNNKQPQVMPYDRDIHGQNLVYTCYTPWYIRSIGAIHFAISKTGRTKVGEMIDTYNSDDILTCKQFDKHCNKQPQTIHYYGDVDGI